MISIASVQNLLTKEDCEKILRRSLSTPVHLVSYKITKFHDGVAGYMGDHLRLTIKYTNKKTTEQTTYFMKTLPQFNLNQLDYVTEAGIFRKEVLLYQNLFSEFLKISRFGPKCFFAKDNLIVLEDLKAQGFKMLSRHVYLDEEHCFSMVKTLARYHASTIIYENTKGVKLDERFKEEIKETCFCFTEGQPRQKWLVSCTNCVSDLMKLALKNCDVDQVCEKYRNFVFEEMPSLLAPSKKFRNVLTHDDLWCNNMLFNDKNECIFIDFQMARCTPPGFDFLVALYLNLECFYVENNLDTFAEVYYSHFVDELEKNNVDSSELPRDEFEETLSFYKLAALVENVMYATHIFISDDLATQIVDDFNNFKEFSFVNRSKFAVKEFRDNKQYRDRLSPALLLLAKTLTNKN